MLLQHVFTPWCSFSLKFVNLNFQNETKIFLNKVVNQVNVFQKRFSLSLIIGQNKLEHLSLTKPFPKARLERFARDKHSSLLCQKVVVEKKL
jgi:hypothetical protein